MAVKAHAGWGWAEQTDKSRKLHASMLGWGTLPETEKEKDRASIRAIPTLLQRIGYTVRKLDDVAGGG
jgi:hypothetical protein